MVPHVTIATEPSIVSVQKDGKVFIVILVSFTSSANERPVLLI